MYKDVYFLDYSLSELHKIYKTIFIKERKERKIAMMTYMFRYFLKDSYGNVNGFRFMPDNGPQAYDVSLEEIQRRFGKSLSGRAIIEKILYDGTFMIRDKVNGILLKGLPTNNSYRTKPLGEIPDVLGKVNEYGQFVAMSEEYYMPIFTRLGTLYYPAPKPRNNREAYMKMYMLMDEILYGRDFLDITNAIQIDSFHPVETNEAYGLKATCHTVVPIAQQDRLKRTISSWLKANNFSRVQFSVWPSKGPDKQNPRCSISITIMPWSSMEAMPEAKKLVVDGFHPSSISNNLVIASFTDGTSAIQNKSVCQTLSAGITNPNKKSRIAYSEKARMHNFNENTQSFIRMLAVPENGSVEGYKISFASPISIIRKGIYAKVCDVCNEMTLLNEVTVRPNANRTVGGYEVPSLVLNDGHVVLNISCPVSFDFIGTDEKTILDIIEGEAKRVFTAMSFEAFAENFDFVLEHYRRTVYPEGSFKNMKSPVEDKDVVLTYDESMKRLNIRVELL